MTTNNHRERIVERRPRGTSSGLIVAKESQEEMQAYKLFLNDFYAKRDATNIFPSQRIRDRDGQDRSANPRRISYARFMAILRELESENEETPKLSQAITKLIEEISDATWESNHQERNVKSAQLLELLMKNDLVASEDAAGTFQRLVEQVAIKSKSASRQPTAFSK